MKENDFLNYASNIPVGIFIILSALIAMLGAFAVQRFIAIRNASGRFRSAVLSALTGLYPEPVSWPSDGASIDDVLRNAFPALQSAISEFRPFIPWWRRGAFDKAWKQYHCSTGRNVDTQVYHHYIGFSDMPDPKVTFYENVSRLLSFAKET